MTREDTSTGRNPSASPADPTVVTTLIGALHNRNGAVRQHAREMLVAVGAPAVDSLVRMLKEPGYLMRWEAAKSLGEIRDARAAPALVEALEDPSADVRWLAAEGLVAIGRSGLLVLLERLARGCSAVWLRQGAHHVIHGLLSSPMSSTIEPVVAALNEPNAEYRVPAAARRALDGLRVVRAADDRD